MFFMDTIKAYFGLEGKRTLINLLFIRMTPDISFELDVSGQIYLMEMGCWSEEVLSTRQSSDCWSKAAAQPYLGLSTEGWSLPEAPL